MRKTKNGMGAAVVAALKCASYTLLLAAAGCGGISTENPGKEDHPLIYGTDDREEYGQVLNTRFQYWADSTGMLVAGTNVTCAGATCTLISTPWTTEQTSGKRLCSNVHYRGQPTLAVGATMGFGGYCTGVLVAPNVMATAGHCHFLGLGCDQTKYVFGYTANASGGGVPTSVPVDNVYQCVSSTLSDYFGTGEDWALDALDRPVVMRPPLNVRYVNQVALNTALAIIGHPMALPMKISPTGNVTAVSDPFLFSHNVESFEGNSGSPVFDSVSGVVEGIHVVPPDGVSHFFDSTDANGACLAETKCPTTGCPGYSAATRITLFSSQIPLIPALIMAAVNG